MHACMRDRPVLSIELDLNWCAAVGSAQWDVCIILRVKNNHLQAMWKVCRTSLHKVTIELKVQVPYRVGVLGAPRRLHSAGP